MGVSASFGILLRINEFHDLQAGHFLKVSRRLLVPKILTYCLPAVRLQGVLQEWVVNQRGKRVFSPPLRPPYKTNFFFFFFSHIP